MDYFTDIYMALPRTNEALLLQQLRQIAPTFVPKFRKLLDSDSLSVNSFSESIEPIFVRLSEAFNDDEFILVGIGHSLDNDTWARRYVRGKVYVRNLQPKWRLEKQARLDA